MAPAPESGTGCSPAPSAHAHAHAHRHTAEPRNTHWPPPQCHFSLFESGWHGPVNCAAGLLAAARAREHGQSTRFLREQKRRLCPNSSHRVTDQQVSWLYSPPNPALLCPEPCSWPLLLAPAYLEGRGRLCVPALPLPTSPCAQQAQAHLATVVQVGVELQAETVTQHISKRRTA